MFKDWHDFYLLLGPASAGLIGLLFVVVSLTTDIERGQALRGARVYLSPIVFHLAVLVTVSGLCMFPDTPSLLVGAVATAAGLIGLAYALYVCREMMAQTVQTFDGDLVRYGLAVAALYLGTAAAGVLVLVRFAWAPQVLASVLMAMFLLMIHNAWDLVIWITPRKPDPPAEPAPPADPMSE